MNDGERNSAVRQRLHPFTILFEAITIARGFILPAAVGTLTAARRDPSEAAMWIALIAGAPALIGGIAKYARFSYEIGDESLVVDSGLLQVQHRVIPWSSVQNVNIRQSALQRMLGVATLTVETATGGAKAEAEFAVLRRASAESLLSRLLAGRRAIPEESITDAPPLAPAEEPETVILHLVPADLVIAGATANHAGLIIAAAAGLLQFADDLPYLDLGVRQLQRLPLDSVSSTVLIGFAAVAMLLVIGWIVSIAGSLIGYYDFTLMSGSHRLHKAHGLLARVSATIPLDRVQAMRVEESVLRRPLGLSRLKVMTAGSAAGQAGSRGAETIAPIARASSVPRLVRAVFPALDYSAIALSPVHPRSKSRAFTVYLSVLLVAAIAAAAWRVQLTVIPVALVIPAWLIAAWQYRHRGYALGDRYMVARNGAFNRVTWLVPEHKLQTLHVRESPFQRRHELATVQLDTAGGGSVASVRDLGYGDAVRLVNSLRLGLAATRIARSPA